MPPRKPKSELTQAKAKARRDRKDLGEALSKADKAKDKILDLGNKY